MRWDKIASRRRKLIPIFLLWLIIFFLWTTYRYFFDFSEIADEFILKPLIFLLPVFVYVFKIEKQPLSSLGFNRHHIQKSLLWGLGLGTIITFEAALVFYLKHPDLKLKPLTANLLISNTALSLATAFSEEVLNRGFLMTRFWQIYQSEFIGNLLAALLFTLLHLPVAIFAFNYQGFNLLTYLLLILILGFTDGFIFSRTKNILAPIISHTLWNLSVIIYG